MFWMNARMTYTTITTLLISLFSRQNAEASLKRAQSVNKNCR